MSTSTGTRDTLDHESVYLDLLSQRDRAARPVPCQQRDGTPAVELAAVYLRRR